MKIFCKTLLYNSRVSKARLILLINCSSHMNISISIATRYIILFYLEEFHYIEEVPKSILEISQKINVVSPCNTFSNSRK